MHNLNTFKTTVFEYAICMSCAQQMQSSMSKESLQNIQKYFKEKELRRL